MTAAALTETLALGALTGMRSLSGPAVLAARRGGRLSRIVATLAAGEMVADKTAFIGNRIDAVPLAGRAVLGALVGGTIARDHRNSVLAGAALGAAAAVAMAHVAFYIRRRLPVSNIAGGLAEDALVAAIGTAAVTRRT
jgi:hypothetical protein